MKVYSNLQKVRVAMATKNLKKSGLNKFAGFNYYELGDFLGQANIEFDKYNLCPVFNIKADDNGIEIATLTIYCTEDGTNVSFNTPTAEANVKGANEIQNLGSKHTYLKRYLYMNALELAEGDAVDATIGKVDKPKENIQKGEENVCKSKATEVQVKKIKELYDLENIAKMLIYYQVEKLEDLSVQQASQVIRKKTTNGTNSSN